MRSIVLCFFVISVVGLFIINAEGRSPRVCEPCKADECTAVSCECGTFKDECNCCDICKKCPREICSLLEGDVCQDGYVCAHPAGTSFMERHNNPGTCVLEAEAPSHED